MLISLPAAHSWVLSDRLHATVQATHAHPTCTAEALGSHKPRCGPLASGLGAEASPWAVLIELDTHAQTRTHDTHTHTHTTHLTKVGCVQATWSRATADAARSPASSPAGHPSGQGGVGGQGMPAGTR